MKDYIKYLYILYRDKGYFKTDWIDLLGWIAYLAFITWVVI